MVDRFRFGVNFLEAASGGQWADKCRHAEALGYDVLLVPDHLGWPAPFPSLVAAAQATTRPRVGTFVLNVGFWNPVLLARDIATTDLLTGGRLEVGLGTGYVRAEFDDARIPFGTPGGRVDHLEHTVRELDRLLTDPSHSPRPEQRPRPQLLLGGNGNRMLRLSARHADIAAFTGAEQAAGAPDGTLRLLDADQLDERVAKHREYTRAQGTDPELNILVQHVLITDDRAAAAPALQPYAPHLSAEQCSRVPTLLCGTVEQIADQLRAHRERYGFSYVTVLEPAMEPMALVIAELRRSEP
ncbi:LLM class F420-dependent oxidoreductase [Streptomyces sp. SL13]|uniref:LLM class F420-dependent oxidoreductase n=1 Tax=Streptantibioticus silvisoli TaxID=2705255 RepID=A0AA90KJB1_9ACTN|nr:LLM class F420-dependent oxidoreductase [Streptantibioticus silvisoli]MDI5961855.1 LLM class F420-dependent oxidoreductase [Streptantibioticus silvisoli]MDI5973409.1 LLM class F420-dependent oxidoreductase [Streptantibioticus silvisoli]